MPRGRYERVSAATTEARALAALSGKQMTVKAIAAALGMSESGASIVLGRLHDSSPKRAYVADHERKLGSGGIAAALWAAGDRHDAEFVPLNCPMPKTSRAERLEQVLALLKTMPRSARELAEAMHVVQGTAANYITRLRKPDNRKVFIKRWRHPSKVCRPGTGGDWTPVYAVGTQPDAPKPERESPSARHQRLSKDDAYREMRRKKRKSHYQIEKMRKKPNTIFGALGL